MTSTKNTSPSKRAAKAQRAVRSQQDSASRAPLSAHPRQLRKRTPSTEPTKLMLQALDVEELSTRVPPQHLGPLHRTMQQIAELLSQPGHQSAVSEAAFQQRAQIAVDTFRVITRGTSRQLQSVIEALEPVTPDDPDTVDLDEAERRGRIRLQALYGKIVADSYSVADLRAMWGISRQRLAQLRREERLFAITVPFQRGMLYPRWQFGPDERPRPIMPNLIKEAKAAGLDAIGFHQLMSNPSSGNGTSPVQMLDYGQEELVLGIIRAADG